MKIEERDMHLKKLKEIQVRANNGIHTHEDYRLIVHMLAKLMKSVNID